MRTDIFIDTDILLYLADSDQAKADRAEDILIDGGIINTLVLAEASFVLVRKWKRPWPETSAMLATFRANTVVLPLTIEAHTRGMTYAERYRLQVYDAILIAAAVLSGCTTLWSEDMHDGLLIDGLTIRNPFIDS